MSRQTLSDIIREAAEEYLDEFDAGMTADEFQCELKKERAALSPEPKPKAPNPKR
jgi:hypothetical protein